MKITDAQKAFLDTVLVRTNSFLSNFYAKTQNGPALIIDIYKSILNPNYVIDGKSEPLNFSIYNSAILRNKNPNQLLPLATSKDGNIHERTHTLWSLVIGAPNVLKDMGLAKDDPEYKDANTKSDSSEIALDAYYNSLAPLVQNYVSQRLKHEISALELISISKKANIDNAAISSASVAGTPINRSIASTQSNSPESPTLAPRSISFSTKLAEEKIDLINKGATPSNF